MPKLNVARSYSLVNLISFYRFQASRVVSTMARPNLVTFCQSYAVFTARLYDTAVFATALCASVFVSDTSGSSTKAIAAR